MDISKIISDFRSWSGSNYRIEKDVPEEKAKYKELKKADSDKDGKIRLLEYIFYLKATQQLVIDQDLYNTAQMIDELRNSEDKARRLGAIRGLLFIGTESAIFALVEAMKNDNEWDVRKMAAIALGIVGDKTLVPPLIETMKTDVNSDVRFAAADALARIQKTLNPSNPTYQEIGRALKPANKH